jgi:hypothetical protein
MISTLTLVFGASTGASTGGISSTGTGSFCTGAGGGVYVELTLSTSIIISLYLNYNIK